MYVLAKICCIKFMLWSSPLRWGGGMQFSEKRVVNITLDNE